MQKPILLIIVAIMLAPPCFSSEKESVKGSGVQKSEARSSEDVLITPAKGSAKSKGSAKTPDYAFYIRHLQRRIKRAWFPPPGQEQVKVVVKFKIHSDGTVSDIRIPQTSGIAVADKAAILAVQNAAPFHSLPVGAPSTVDVQFTFNKKLYLSEV